MRKQMTRYQVLGVSDGDDANASGLGTDSSSPLGLPSGECFRSSEIDFNVWNTFS